MNIEVLIGGIRVGVVVVDEARSQGRDFELARRDGRSLGSPSTRIEISKGAILILTKGRCATKNRRGGSLGL